MSVRDIATSTQCSYMLLRAIELADKKNVSMYEIAVAYVINQKFPVVALTGAESPEEVAINTKAGSLLLSDEEINWLDLTKN